MIPSEGIEGNSGSGAVVSLDPITTNTTLI